MRTLTLDEIEQLQHGELIPRFTGRITKVFDQRIGYGDYGTWYLQTFILGAGNQEISVTYTGEDKLNAWEGALVSIECSDNNGKLSGVKRDIRTKDGKQYKGVKISPGCKIKRLNDGEPTSYNKLMELKAKGEHFQDDSEIEQQTVTTSTGLSGSGVTSLAFGAKPKPNGAKIHEYAAHSARVFMIAWDKAKEVMAAIPSKDGEEMTAYEWNDLRIRIAQNFAIEINKIIRKERF